MQTLNNLKLPIIAAPMFLASGPELVIECCKAGIVGTFPALNQRTSEEFESWLVQIKQALHSEAEQKASTGKAHQDLPAPYGVNLVVHKSNPRAAQDLELCVRHEVPLVITSLGAAKEVVDAVHSYGGLVFHDAVNARYAKKAADAGVDGIICVSSGAGGHAGAINPFALLAEVRAVFNGTLLLGGCLSTGQDVAAAQMMGADLAYMGTRFINTHESLVDDAYRDMIIRSKAEDIIYTPKVSGVPASFMRESMIAAGLDPNDKRPKEVIDYGTDLSVDAPEDAKQDQSKEKKKGAWADIWSAGQGVASISDVVTVKKLVDRLEREYRAAVDRFQSLQ